MSSPDVTLETLLVELRQLAVDVSPIAAHLAQIDAQLAELPQSAEVDALRADIEELKIGFAELKAFQAGPPPVPDRLKALEADVAAFKAATRTAEADIREDAGKPADAAHTSAIRDVTAPAFDRAEADRGKIRNQISESEARSALGIADMRGRISEFGQRLTVLAAVVRENQSAMLVVIAVAALMIAGLVLVTISAFGSPFG